MTGQARCVVSGLRSAAPWLVLLLVATPAAGQPLSNHLNMQAILRGTISELDPTSMVYISRVLLAGDGSYWVQGRYSDAVFVGSENEGNVQGADWPFVSRHASDGSPLGGRVRLSEVFYPRNLESVYPLLVLKDGSLLVQCSIEKELEVYDEMLLRIAPDGTTQVSDRPVQGFLKPERVIEDGTGGLHIFSYNNRYLYHYRVGMRGGQLHVGHPDTFRLFPRPASPGSEQVPCYLGLGGSVAKVTMALADSGHVLVAVDRGQAGVPISIYRLRLSDLTLVDSCRAESGTDETHLVTGHNVGAMRLLPSDGKYWLFVPSRASAPGTSGAARTTSVFQVSPRPSVIRPPSIRHLDVGEPVTVMSARDATVATRFELTDENVAGWAFHAKAELDLQFTGYDADGRLYYGREHGEALITISRQAGQK